MKRPRAPARDAARAAARDSGRLGVSALLRATLFAAEKHRDHRRKGTVAAPYINHPILVAEQLATAGFEDDTELLMAALLHDVIEDTDTSEAELAAAFGPRVASIVVELSDDKSLRRRDRRAAVVRTIAGRSREARLVKLSDLIANVFDVIHHPPPWDDEQKQDYLDWGAAVVREVRGTHPALERRFAELLAQARAMAGEPA